MINLAEAVKLKSILAKKVQELVSELHRSAFVTVEKGQAPKTSNRAMKVIEAELAQVRLDVRTLDRLVCMKKKVYAWVMVKLQCFMKLLCTSQMITANLL
ncbi:hypothetical protein ACFTQ7_19445 [Lysinibacillus sp. NPDC056959]|uniref:hypothetical protein n=1 Tax=Lysinibacillus sp. NPDC056959 TaxID=3345981 RepID=UPI00363B5DC8